MDELGWTTIREPGVVNKLLLDAGFNSRTWEWENILGRFKGQRPAAIKVSSSVLPQAFALAESCPAVLIVREPAAVLSSIMRDPPAWCANMNPAERLRRAAEHLLALYRAALQYSQSGIQVIDYRDLCGNDLIFTVQRFQPAGGSNHAEGLKRIAGMDAKAPNENFVDRTSSANGDFTALAKRNGLESVYEDILKASNHET